MNGALSESGSSFVRVTEGRVPRMSLSLRRPLRERSNAGPLTGHTLRRASARVLRALVSS